MSSGGKGDQRRPSSVTPAEIASNWQSIFGLSKLEQRLAREKALDELVAENQRLGLYDDYDKITRNNLETQQVKN